MYPINYFLFLLVAFIPMIIGYAWYHPNVFGKYWEQESKFDNTKTSYFGFKQLVLVYLLSFLYAFSRSDFIISYSCPPSINTIS